MDMGCRNGLARAALVTSVLAIAGHGTAFAADAQLADAAERRQADVVATLLDQGLDADAPQPDGATALHWAAHWNDLAKANQLMAAGANVNVINEYGVTPLFLAATNGSDEMVDLLIEGGADPNIALPSGETPLMASVRSGSLPAVNRLLGGGAAPNTAQVSKGQTALMWAVAGEDSEIIRALLAAGADLTIRSTEGSSPLMFAARTGRVSVSRLLLDAGNDINASASDGSTPLLIATVRGHADLAMFLLDEGAKPDGNLEDAGYTPLHWAVSKGETPVSYAGTEAPGEWRAIPGVPDEEKRLALIDSLLMHGANIEARSSKPLPAWLPFEQRSRPGSTPFYTAAAGGDATVMRLLLAWGADPLARNAQDQSTPLMAICGNVGPYLPKIEHAFTVTEDDRLEAFQLAWKLGNDLDAEDQQGYRAMHYAAGAGFHRLIEFMLNKGAELNPLSKGSRMGNPPQTPLGLAEGYLLSTLFKRPDTTECLRGLGAESVGAATLEDTIEQQAGQAGADPAQSRRPPQDGTAPRR